MIDHAVDALATFRLTRLITKDQITADLRGRVVRRVYLRDRAGAIDTPGVRPAEWATVPLDDDLAPNLATLITCEWCTSVWIAFGVLAARRLAPDVWDPIARALALSAVAGLVSNHAG